MSVSSLPSSSERLSTERQLFNAVSNESWHEVESLVDASDELSVNGKLIFRGVPCTVLYATVGVKGEIGTAIKWETILKMINKDPNVDINAKPISIAPSIVDIIASKIPLHKNNYDVIFPMPDEISKKFIDLLSAIFTRFPHAEISKESVIRILNRLEHDKCHFIFNALDSLLLSYKINDLVDIKPHLISDSSPKHFFYGVAISPGTNGVNLRNFLAAAMANLSLIPA